MKSAHLMYAHLLALDSNLTWLIHAVLFSYSMFLKLWLPRDFVSVQQSILRDPCLLITDAHLVALCV